MAEDKEKIIEKRYIEVSASGKQRFLLGLLGGLGWGVGLTIGTTAILAILGYIVARIDFVPILSQFLADIVKSAQQNLQAK